MKQVRKRMRRGLALLLAVLQVMLVFAVVPVSAADDVVASGTCGENLTWTLSGGTLTISGSGEMKNYSWESVPWYSSRTTIQSVVIEDGVTYIGESAFWACSSLTSVVIPDSVTTIGGYAFSECSSLTSVTIPDSVTTIGGYAFSECSSLTSVTIPDSVTTIGSGTFGGCSSLTSVDIPEGVTTIGSGAFGVIKVAYQEYSGCTNLQTVTLPERIKTIDYAAFNGCDNLSDVYYNGRKKAWNDISKAIKTAEKGRLVDYQEH